MTACCGCTSLSRIAVFSSLLFLAATSGAQALPQDRIRTAIRDSEVQQVAASFQTAIHRYVLNGEEHYGNSTEPSIPTALASIVSAVKGLNDFRPQPKTIRRAVTRPSPDLTDGTTNHFLAPADFNLIYNVQPLCSRGIDGIGQKIVDAEERLPWRQREAAVHRNGGQLFE